MKILPTSILLVALLSLCTTAAMAAPGPYTAQGKILDATVTGTCGAPSSVIVSTEGAASVGVDANGSFSATATAYAYFGPDGWQAIPLTPWSGGSTVNTFTGPGAWYWTVVVGATQVCTIITTAGTGTASIRLDASVTPAPGSSGGSGGAVSGTVGLADGGVVGIAPGAVIGLADGGFVGTEGIVTTTNPTYSNSSEQPTSLDAVGDVRSSATDITGTLGTLGALSASVLGIVQGRDSASVTFSSPSSPLLTVACSTTQNGSGGPACTFVSGTGVLSTTIVNPTAGSYGILIPPGTSALAVLVSAYTSGSISAQIFTVNVPGYCSGEGVSGNPLPLPILVNNATALGNGLPVLPAVAIATPTARSATDSEALECSSVNGSVFTSLVGNATTLVTSGTGAGGTTAVGTGLQMYTAEALTAPTAEATGDLAMEQIDAAFGGQFMESIPTTIAGAATTPVVVSVNTTSGLKAAAGNVYGISVANPAATVCYVQFYNSNAPTCGTSPLWSLAVPATGVVNIPPGSLALGNFTTGIGTCFSTTAAGSTTCTGTVSETIFIK